MSAEAIIDAAEKDLMRQIAGLDCGGLLINASNHSKAALSVSEFERMMTRTALEMRYIEDDCVMRQLDAVLPKPKGLA